MSTTAVLDRRATAVGERDDDRLLLWVAAFFTLAVLVHNADHLRRGADTVTWEVFSLGMLAIPLEAGIVVLCCWRHRLAPLAAALTGSVLTVGYIAVHFVPRWSELSDSFTSAGDASPLSWGAASLEVVGASLLAAVGYLIFKRRQANDAIRSRGEDDRPLRAAVLHPLALVMIVGNAAVLGISIAQVL